VATGEPQAQEQSNGPALVAKLGDIIGAIKDQFTDPRDEGRVKQATTSLETAQMAIQHLHDTRQNRIDLVKVHEEEAKYGGHYAMERQNFPQMYENHYPADHKGA
jgi:hypothetical protein